MQATIETAAPNVERWQRCNRKGFAHLEVSNLGRVRNGKTLRPYAYTYPDGRRTHRPYVSVSAAVGSGEKHLTISVAKLVWESWNNIILPARVKIEHKNNDLTDNRLNNLHVPGHVARASVPTTVTILPTIRPESAPPPPPAPIAAPVLSERDKKAIARYERLITEARQYIATGQIESIRDFDALNLTDDDMIDVLQDMSPADVTALVLNLVKLARENGKE